jgi:distribution and morphology protein 10
MSSRFGFNVYSWESEIVLGWEMWRRRRRVAPLPKPNPNLDPSNPTSPPTEPAPEIDIDWIYTRLLHQHSFATSPSPNAFNLDTTRPSDFDPDPWRTKSLLEARTAELEKDDSVLKIRMDQNWNVRVLWEGRVKELLVSAGVSMGPGLKRGLGAAEGLGWRGVGIEVSYSS